MMGSMRTNKKNQTAVWIILGLLIVGLIGFGGAGAGGGTIRTIATVGDEKVSVDAYAQAVSTSLNSLSQQAGRQLTALEAEQLGLQRQVMEGLLTTAALDDAAKKLGLSIGDEAVRQQLLATASFQGIDGSFDNEAYQNALQNARLSTKEYEDILRKQASRGFIESAILNGVQSQGTQTQALLSYDRETRDFTWIELTADALDAPVATPTDAQIQMQYEATPEAYTAPLSREITYAWLSPEMLSDQVNIDEALIQESYDLQPDRFNKAEKRNLDRIVFGSMEEAKAARSALDANTQTFDTIISERGLTAEDVNLGDVQIGGIAKAAADLIFSTNETGILGPVESSLGPAIFRVNAVLAKDVTPFEDARAEIVGELAGEAARRLVNDIVEDVDDLLAGDATIEELVRDTDMQLGTISLSADTSDGIAAYENFRTIANQSEPGDYPEINNFEDGSIFALRVDEIKQPKLRTLDEVKDQVILDWKAAETVRLLTKKAEELRDGLNIGGSFSVYAVNIEKNVRRSGFIENTPYGLLDTVYNLEANKAEMIAGPNSVFVARLDAVNAFDTTTDDNKALAISVQQRLDIQIANDLLSTFSNALRANADVSINQEAINQINAQLTGGYAGGHGGGNGY
ncbi:hypothetical protein F9L33_02715 [Amylibacter sp. SFDW26]|uniref:peptidylprolyl isomerase n=1 Tax=Amylibacter sp. SFDW26 TaxID=2652722 RepID=UPI0012614295|nr:peptidylprolyl isomerase [Amylibacter sp. SFDW26]KAB7615692.1 hypothetical protein F9L33_02715 [Amylibacter sp. SFDW26]